MNVKQAAQRAEPAKPEVRYETIHFEMDGLIQTDDGFALANVPTYNVDFAGHLKMLHEESGVNKELAMRAVEQMAEFVYIQSIATIFAKRMKRTG